MARQEKKMNRLLFKIRLALCGIVLSVLTVGAAPDYLSGKYLAIRESYSNELVSIERTCHETLVSHFSKQAKDLKARSTRARLSGNKNFQADVAEFQRIVDWNLRALSKGQSVRLPDRVRPGNDRFLSVLKSSTASAMRAKDDSTALLRMNCRDRLRKLLEQDGVDALRDGVLDQAWDDLLAARPKVEQEEAPAAVDGGDFVDGGDEAVYAKSAEAARWRVLARLDLSAGAMEIISIPLYPLKAGKKTFSGTSAQGVTWSATVLSPAAIGEPAAGAFAFRVKSVGELPRVGIVDWPTEANGWRLGLRIRPRGNQQKNSCLLEIGER